MDLLSTARSLLRRASRPLPEPVRYELGRAVRLVRPARLKVSVVVAAHDTDPAGLARVVASLDRQTMPAEHFEVVVVDDGSTDGTRGRLDRIAASRPNWRVRTIPASGWSSRPRNIAVRMARGQYVLFLDHDDELFADALERCHAYGVAHRADVVHAKEVRTRVWDWGFEHYVANVPHATELRPNPLYPMTPHKMYRRDFLLRHRIRFPEGRRVFWEDIHFNVAVFAAGARVALLSDRPAYHWVATGANNSSGFVTDQQEYWGKLTDLLDEIARVLPPEAARALLRAQVQTRVLFALGPPSLERTEESYALALRAVTELVRRHAPVHEDPLLTPVHRARAELVRRGDEAALRALAAAEAAVSAAVTVTSVAWDGGHLVLELAAELVVGDGEPLLVRREGQRWVRVVPPAVAAVLSPAALDVTDAVAAAAFDLVVRGRRSRATWTVPSEGSFGVVEGPDGTGRLAGTLRARFDPVATEARAAAEDPLWDFGTRLEAMGFLFVGAVRGGRTAVAVVGDRAMVAYVNREGILSLDTHGAVRALSDSTPVPAEAARASAEAVDGVARSEPVVAIDLRLPEVHCHGEARVDGDLLLGERAVPATLAAAESGARIRASAAVPVGTHPLRTRFHDRTGATGLELVVTEQGAVVRRGATPTAGAPGPATTAPALLASRS